jgi:hypothetical protein
LNLVLRFDHEKQEERPEAKLRAVDAAAMQRRA